MWGWHSHEDKAEGTVVPQDGEVIQKTLTERKQNHGHLSYLRLENSKEFPPIEKISYWGFEKGGESALAICLVLEVYFGIYFIGSLFWVLLSEMRVLFCSPGLPNSEIIGVRPCAWLQLC